MNLAEQVELLSRLSDRVIFYPVRHHSPTSALLVRELIESVSPQAVLIEGPRDYNPYLTELQLAHRLPIAIYSYVLYEASEARRSRNGVYYPFCVHSPEWQAMQTAWNIGAEVQFIDLPWKDLVSLEQQENLTNRYADRISPRNEFVEQFCQRLGVDSYSDAWDELLEVPQVLRLEEYLKRCHTFCLTLRWSEETIPFSDQQREAAMASMIRQKLEEVSGTIVVVTGGFHSLGLWQRLQKPKDLDLTTSEASTNPELLEEQAPPQVERPKVLDAGIALTPYSFERLDALKGYNAGMPNPGFYHLLWEARSRGEKTSIHGQMLRQVVLYLRQRQQLISAADLIAAETNARSLARLRGHDMVWRTDFVDGLCSAIIKDDATGFRHPILQAIDHVLRGGERGQLAEGTRLPPLVQDIQRLIREYDLSPEEKPRTLDCDLLNPEQRRINQTLHRFQLLNLPGYRLIYSTLEDHSEGRVLERWEIIEVLDFSSSCIEAARYGASLGEAVSAVLLEKGQQEKPNSLLASQLLFQAASAGLEALSEEFFVMLQVQINSDGDFFSVSQALDRLLALFRYDQVLGYAGRRDLAEIVHLAFDRSLLLLESLGQVTDQLERTVLGIRALLEVAERTRGQLDLDRQRLIDVFRQAAEDRYQHPSTRGALLGGLWVLGETHSQQIITQLQSFAQPTELGDFLSGLFVIARDQVQRQKNLILSIHHVLTEFALDDFLVALPSLRWAFSVFTPREKHHMALNLRSGLDLQEIPQVRAFDVPPEIVVQSLRLEERIWQLAAKFGIQIE